MVFCNKFANISWFTNENKLVDVNVTVILIIVASVDAENTGVIDTGIIIIILNELISVEIKGDYLAVHFGLLSVI